MTSTPPPADAQEYLENLMRAGQDAMKQFDDALVLAAGVSSKDSLSSGRLFFPFALIVDLQREYFKQLWQFWNSAFLQTFAGGEHSSLALARSDKRFKGSGCQFRGLRCVNLPCENEGLFGVMGDQVEGVATVLALEHRVIPPTLGYEIPDPELDLDYVPGEARPLIPVNGGPPVAVSDSFAFGGHNVALVFRGALR